MGLIRKSLAVGTLGVVNGSSKKQRVARATMQNTAATAALMRQQLAADQRRADEEAEYRYATDATYRAYVDNKRAAEAAARAQRLRLAAERRHARSVRLQQAVAVPALMLVFMVTAVAVWAPQMAVGAARRQKAAPWMRDKLAATWRGVLDKR